MSLMYDESLSGLELEIQNYNFYYVDFVFRYGLFI